MLFFMHSFQCSLLGGKRRNATVADLMSLNQLIHDIRGEASFSITFSSQLRLEDCAVVGISDASFDNMPNRKSQGGVLQ